METSSNKQITLRVYGVCIDDRQRVLVTDEIFWGNKVTKFPGGGLQYGEGTLDCVKREFVEETNNEIEVIKHLYTTDFFQPSAYHNHVQVICVYYLVRFKTTVHNLAVKVTRFDFPKEEHGAQVFRWIPLGDLLVEEFNLPIDRVVVEMIKKGGHL